MDIVILVLLAVIIVLLIVLLVRTFHQKTEKGGGDGLQELFLQEAGQIKAAINTAGKASSEALFMGVQATNHQILERVKENNENNAQKIEDMRTELAKNLLEIRTDIKSNLTEVREDNAKQLEAMRIVVDEKLTTTLNERLSQSFTLISERLEAVSKGLGEMQTLAAGVTDLKKVLTNVKSRGTWGEVSLEGVLQDILTPEQYEKNCNVSLRGSQQRVDYAILLPGSDGETVYLPIDVKFPVEDYQRMGDAAAEGNQEVYRENLKQLMIRVRKQAADIRDKYIKPPKTTDFAIMYLPVEGLYGEILRQNGLVEELQNTYKVIPAGPTNLAAMLSTVRMGFRTLSIQKHSKEIFEILYSFRKEFARFADLLSKAQGQINNASKSLEEAEKKTETITRKLSKMDSIQLPGEETLPPLIE